LTKRAAVVETDPKQTKARDQSEKGDHAELDEVRAALDTAPGVVKELGDLGRAALLMEVDSFAGKNVLMREAQKRYLAQLQTEIEGPNPSSLERLLAQEVVLCRQHLASAQALCAALHEYSFAQGEFHERQIERAQRRYLAAIKTLAQIRRLELPAVQVNVAAEGGKQINVTR
jgi:hypothetical protein